MFSLLLTAALAVTPADVWPGFRGDGTSIAAADNLPLTWSEKQGIAWQAGIPGVGQSSPVAWRDRVFVTSVVGDSKESAVVSCFELSSGRELWRQDFKSTQPAKLSNYISQAAPTPAVDADRVYAFFETGNLAALNHAGEVTWQRSLTADYGQFLGNHGVGSSILLTEKAVIVLVDHSGPSYLLAVSKTDGKTLWKTDRPQKVSWSSPILARDKEGSRIIVSSNGSCSAFDPVTGKQLWIVEGLDGNTVPSATVADDLILVGSSKAGANVAIRRGGTGNVSDSHMVWRSADASATFSSPLAWQGHVYMVNRAGVAFCLDQQTGKTVWTKRIGGSCWASPLAAKDRVYFFGKSGETTVVAAGSELKVLAENSLPTTDRVYGVAAVNNRFVLRTGSQLLCLSTKTAPSKKGNQPVSDPATDKSATDKPAAEAQLPALPRAITSFGADVLGDSLYVYGGFHGTAHHYSQQGQSDQLLQLDLKHPTEWKVAATGPKLQGHALVAHGGKLYRVGGFTARNTEKEDQDLWSLTDFARFDPKTKKWEQLPPMPTPRSSFDAIVIGDTLYVVGGWSMQGDKDAEWQETALAVDLTQSPLKWRTIAKPPFQRRALATATLDGKLYAVGGMQPDGKVTRRTAIYDPKSNEWSEGPELPGEDMNGFGAAAFPLGNRLYVTTALGQLLALSEEGTAWKSQGKSETARFFHRMLPVDPHHFALIGGASMQTGKFAETERLKVSP